MAIILKMKWKNYKNNYKRLKYISNNNNSYKIKTKTCNKVKFKNN